jgi:DNA topoisomerase IB
LKKPLDLPPGVASTFVSTMKDYFAEADNTKRDAIAARQLSVLSQYQSPREKPLRLSDVKQMFVEMKSVIG